MPRDAKNSDTDAIPSQLIDAFLPYINKRALENKGCGLDRDDVVQEGLIGLFGAIRSYDAEKGAGFSTYAYACINNAIASALRAAGRKKHSPLNSAVPIEDAELICDGQTPEQATIFAESLAALKKKIDDELSPLEKRVLHLFAAGKSYTEIADEISRPEKSVDNAMQRIRKKLKG